MLRSIFIACCLAAAAGPAFAEGQDRTPEAAPGMEIRDDSGNRIGRVANVERDEAGNIVSIAATDLEAPADAPPYIMAPRRGGPPVLVAQGQSRERTAANGAPAGIASR